MTRTHCNNGHDWIPENIATNGRNRSECRLCRRASQRRAALSKREGGGANVPSHLPAEPLLRYLNHLGGLRAVLDACGVTASSPEGNVITKRIERVRAQEYVTANIADRVCIELLGIHPSMVYGDDWWVAA